MQTEYPKRDPRIVEAMRDAMRAGRNNASILIANIEDFAPSEVRRAYEKLIDTVEMVARETSHV